MNRLLTVISLAFTTVLFSSNASAQAASFAPFGFGCGVGGPPPLMQCPGLPVIGSTMQLQRVALPGGTYPTGAADLPMVVFGLTPLPTPIPLTGFPIQPSNCFLRVSADLVQMMAMPSPTSFSFTHDVPIPSNSALAGMQFDVQMVSVYISPSIGLGRILTTNAGTATVGF